MLTARPIIHRGFTLVEILVALVINIIVLTALIAMFTSNVGHVNQMTKTDLLNQQLQTAMQIMTGDIRRAGYWANASADVGTGQNNNPFMAPGADVTINAGNNCILFTYDYDNNHVLSPITGSADDERYGFRLINQILQARPPGAAFNCTAAASAWENVTDPNIVRITALTFFLSTVTVPPGATSDRMAIRSVDISITGQLVSDASLTKILSQHVRIRNDKYLP